MDKQFDFKCCWTCRHCYFDIVYNKYTCNHNGHINKRMFKFEATKPTDCKNWKQDGNN